MINLSTSLNDQICKLLTLAELSSPIISVKQCYQGGNNRTYRVETQNGLYAVKQYFRQESDSRDRLASEFSFLHYAAQVAPKKVPACYSKDDQAGLALYEFIEGTPLKTDEISQNEVNEAIDFFCLINHSSDRSHTNAIPKASEACFSINAHLELIHNRILDIQHHLRLENTIDQLANKLLLKIHTYWQRIKENVIREAQRKRIDLETLLPMEMRCLSPSDFGFHNALRLKDNTLCFLDFEYAGWDDPAKMVGDFFSQLAIPVKLTFFDHFVNKVMVPFNQSEELIFRAKLLRPVYQIKWCCIALNIFIPYHLARRKFSNPHLDEESLKNKQLNSVTHLINHLEINNYV